MKKISTAAMGRIENFNDRQLTIRIGSRRPIQPLLHFE